MATKSGTSVLRPTLKSADGVDDVLPRMDMLRIGPFDHTLRLDGGDAKEQFPGLSGIENTDPFEDVGGIDSVKDQELGLSSLLIGPSIPLTAQPRMGFEPEIGTDVMWAGERDSFGSSGRPTDDRTLFPRFPILPLTISAGGVHELPTDTAYLPGAVSPTELEEITTVSGESTQHHFHSSFDPLDTAVDSDESSLSLDDTTHQPERDSESVHEKENQTIHFTAQHPSNSAEPQQQHYLQHAQEQQNATTGYQISHKHHAPLFQRQPNAVNQTSNADATSSLEEENRSNEHRNQGKPTREVATLSDDAPSFVPKAHKNAQSQARSTKSTLLEEFQNNKNLNLQLSELRGSASAFARDQYGSRFIQLKLESATDAQKEMLFTELLPEAESLMRDVFGNYVIQKFLEYGSEAQKAKLAVCLKGNVLSLSQQVYGCRVIQKAIEELSPSAQEDIIAELDGHIIDCVQDQNGNHVIQKFIECSGDNSSVKKKIVSAFRGHAAFYASHSYGCRVIQRIFEYCPYSQTEPLLDELLSTTESLVLNQYGNYVIQHVIERGTSANRTSIINRLKGKFAILAQHKFASNVLEKCVQFGSNADRDTIITELSENSSLFVMAKDQFGNYVIQKMFDCCSRPQCERIAGKLRPHLAALRHIPFAKHVVAKVERLNPESERGERTQRLDGSGNFENILAYPPLHSIYSNKQKI